MRRDESFNNSGAATLAPSVNARESKAVERLEQLAIPGPDRQHQRFFLVFIATFLFGLICIGFFNYLINATGAYQPKILPPIVWRYARAEKLNLLASAQPKPKLFVFGSSKTMLVSPKTLERLLGLPALNLCVNLARPEDHYVFLRAAVEKMGIVPRMILLGIDIEAFEDRPVDEWLLQTPELKEYLLFDEGRFLTHDKLTQLLSWWQTRLSVISLAHWLGFKKDNNPQHFDNQGLLHYDRWELEKRSGRYPLRQRIQASVADYQAMFKNYKKVSNQRTAYFSALAQYCKRHGIQLIAFIPPMHDQVVESLRSFGYEQRKQEVTNYLQTTAKTWGSTFIDLDQVGRFDGKPDDFYDGAHIDAANSDRLVLYLYHNGYLTTGPQKRDAF